MTNVDAVSIVTPTNTHKEISCWFMEHGIHCLIEKPIAHTIADAKYMVECSKRNNVKVLIGHIETFNPAVQRLKQELQDDIIGNIMYASARRLGPYVSRIMDVGIALDSASHDVGVIRFLLGSSIKQSYLRNWSIKNEKGDYALLFMDMGDKAASIEVNWFTPYKIRTLDITGDKGTLHLDYIKQTVDIFTDKYSSSLTIVNKEPLKEEILHFIDCIENDKTPYVSCEEGLEILKIVLGG